MKNPARKSVQSGDFRRKHAVVHVSAVIGLASADVTAERDAWKRIATGKTGSKQTSVPYNMYKGMLGDRTFTCQSSFFPHQEF